MILLEKSQRVLDERLEEYLDRQILVRQQLLDIKIENPKVEFKLKDLPEIKAQQQQPTLASTEPTGENVLKTLKDEFKDENKDVKIKTTIKQINGQKEKLLVIENLDIEDGPRKIQKKEKLLKALLCL